MSSESYKAENSDELIWLRLNRLKSTKLCENLIRAKLEREPNANFTDEIIRAKAVGVSSAIESAIGYWQAQSTSCNARILSRHYFMLQMTIAEQKENPLLKYSIGGLIEKVIHGLVGLDERFKKAGIEMKRKIVCSLFPEKLEFDGVEYRTPRTNLAAKAIMLINSFLTDSKKWKEAYCKSLSLLVAPIGIEHLFA